MIVDLHPHNFVGSPRYVDDLEALLRLLLQRLRGFDDSDIAGQRRSELSQPSPGADVVGRLHIEVGARTQRHPGDWDHRLVDRGEEWVLAVDERGELVDLAGREEDLEALRFPGCDCPSTRLESERPGVMAKVVAVEGLEPGECPLEVQGDLRIVQDLDFDHPGVEHHRRLKSTPFTSYNT